MHLSYRFHTAENAVCQSSSTVHQSNHFTKILRTSEYIKVLTFPSTGQKATSHCIVSWMFEDISFLLDTFSRCIISRLSYNFHLTSNIFANGTLILQLHSACSFMDAMFSSKNFWKISASCLSCMCRALQRTNLHISVFPPCATHPKEALVNFHTKSFSYSQEQSERLFLGCWVFWFLFACFFRKWQNLELWEAIRTSGTPYWFSWFSEMNMVEPYW